MTDIEKSKAKSKAYKKLMMGLKKVEMKAIKMGSNKELVKYILLSVFGLDNSKKRMCQ